MDEAAFFAELARRLGPVPAPRADPTLDELLKKWADAHGRLASFACDHARALRFLGVEPFTFPDGEGRELARFYEPGGARLKDRHASALTLEDVDDFRVWFYGQTTRRKGPPSTATVNRYVMMLKRVLNHAVKRRTIERSPLFGLDDEDEDNAREVVIEEDQLAELLHALDGPMMRALVLLAYDSGMRRAELLACRWSWLDVDAGQVHVPAAIAKNGEARVTDLSVRAWEALEELTRHLRSDLVFPNPATGEAYGGRWIHERFVRAVESSGVIGRDGTPPRLHDLRRSFITLAGRRGIPETVIMAKSGHKDHKVFTRYRIVHQSELRDAWLLMEAGRQRDLERLAERRLTARPVGTSV